MIRDKRFHHTLTRGTRRAEVYFGEDSSWHVDCFDGDVWHRSAVRGGRDAQKETIGDACAFVNVISLAG